MIIFLAIFRVCIGGVTTKEGGCCPALTNVSGAFVAVETVPCMSDDNDDDDAEGNSAGVLGREGIGIVESAAWTISIGSIEIPRVIGSVWAIGVLFELLLFIVPVVVVGVGLVSSVISSISVVVFCEAEERPLMRNIALGFSFAIAPRRRKGRAGLSWM